MKVFPVGFKAEDVMNEFDSTAENIGSGISLWTK